MNMSTSLLSRMKDEVATAMTEKMTMAQQRAYVHQLNYSTISMMDKDELEQYVIKHFGDNFLTDLLTELQQFHSL